MKIQDYPEGIYIHKNGKYIAEIVWKTTITNHPQIVGNDEDKPMSLFFSNCYLYKYFMENYVFCCEF